MQATFHSNKSESFVQKAELWSRRFERGWLGLKTCCVHQQGRAAGVSSSATAPVLYLLSTSQNCSFLQAKNTFYLPLKSHFLSLIIHAFHGELMYRRRGGQRPVAAERERKDANCLRFLVLTDWILC